MKEKICLFLKVLCMTTLFVVSASCGLFSKNAFAADDFITGGAGTCNVDVLGVSDESVLAKAIAVYQLQKYTCVPGTYLNITDTEVLCDDCPLNSYCPGGTFSVEDTYLGQNLCPENYITQSENSVSQSDCVLDCDWDCSGTDCVPCLPEVTDGFIVMTSLMNDGDEFKFDISAAGTYTIDWGDGNIETITKTNIANQTLAHKYETTGQFEIKISGSSTAYSTELPAISFQCKNDQDEYITNFPIVGIRGSLGAVFPTIGNEIQPLFIKTFYGCDKINSTKIPSGLFSGITGKPVAHMFDSTFAGMDQITEIPNNFTFGVSGEPAESVFAFTFANTNIRTIPTGFFTGISGKPADKMFQGTFSNTRLSEIPSDLFSGITGSADEFVGKYMFANTFEGTAIKSVPGGLFSSIRGKPAEGMFSNTFANSSLETIPHNLFETISGSPAPYMFQRTFAYTSIQTIPEDLFIKIDGAPAQNMFVSTFEGCKDLSGQVPGGLFQNIKGDPVDGMFTRTFYRASGLSSWIPPQLFKDINATEFKPGQMSDVFLGTGIMEQCPADMVQYITGFEADFDSKVSCAFCPENSTVHGEAGQTYCKCNDGYTVSGVLNGNSDVAQGETCDAITIKVVYMCTENADEPASLQVVNYNDSISFADGGTLCTKGGYKFTGWQLKNTDKIFEQGLTLKWAELAAYNMQSMVLIATYTPDDFVITYNCADGTLTEGASITQNVTHLSQFTTSSEICTKANHVQTGWIAYSGEKPFEYGLNQTATYNFWENKTFTATYISAYTIKYSCGEGTGTAPTKQAPILQDEEYIPQNNTCIPPAGYSFDGWAVSNTENIVQQPGQIYNYTFWEDKTFTAIYKPNCNKITLDATTHGGISVVESVSQKTGQAQYYASECYAPWSSVPVTPTKANATFSGFWNTPDLEGGVQCVNSDKSFTYNDECNTTGPTTWYARFACNDGYTAAGVNIAGECKEKSYTITYDCGEGMGTPPPNQSIREGSNFTPHTNTCVKAGYTLNYWTTTNDGVTDAYYENVSKPYKYDHDIKLTAVYKIKPYSPDLTNPAFTILFQPNMDYNTSIIINIKAAGEFKIEWGDGKVEKISSSRAGYGSYEHEFPSSRSSNHYGPYFINIYGQASGYETTVNLTDRLSAPVIDFHCPDNNVQTVQGSLGALFPTLKDGSQPSFEGTFANCKSLKSFEQDKLFKGISGKPRAYMFARTFINTDLERVQIYKDLFADIGGEDSTVPGLFEATFAGTGIEDIDQELFSNIKGVPKASMFAGTFSSCRKLNLYDKHNKLFRTISGPAAPYLFSGTFSGSGLTSIPDGLFDTIEGPTTNGSAEGLFYNTFSGTKIETIPADLFKTIESKPYPHMFHNTFYKCYNLTEIPTGLFDSIQGPITDANDVFSGTFNMESKTDKSTGITKIPDGLFKNISGNPAINMFNGTFRNTNITSIPSDLFSGISGVPKSGMFLGTFMETNITEIPENLFAKIKGDPAKQDVPAEGMFQQTFENTPITYIPAGLFKNISGNPVARMFQQTFKNCNKISSQIPENLFAGITGTLQSKSFYETFFGAINPNFAGDTYNFIPPNLFNDENISGASNSNEAMYNVVTDSNLRTKCPPTHKRVKTGFEDWFSGKVTCAPCPGHADQREKNEYQCECDTGYGPGKPGDTYSNWVNESGDNLDDGEICLPIRDKLRFFCQETVFGWNNEFDNPLYAYFNEPFTFPTQKEFEEECGSLNKCKILSAWHFYANNADTAGKKYEPGSVINWKFIDQDNQSWFEPEFMYDYNNPDCDPLRVDWEHTDDDWEFIIVTTPDTQKFKIKIAANVDNSVDVFTIDWGDGKQTTPTPWLKWGWIYNHEYEVPGTYVIKMKGDAKNYPNLDNNLGIKSVIGFDEYVTNIRRIYRSLGDLFPTLSNGTQPKFQEVFKGAINLDGTIPERLFTGTKKSDGTYPVYGIPRASMFESAFEGCSKLSGTIPSKLFSPDSFSYNPGILTSAELGLRGPVATRMFANTFKGCSSLTGKIPELFKNFYNQAESVFAGTFEGCSGLTGISSNLFGGDNFGSAYTGSTTQMFENTFKDCSGLTGGIPGNLFSRYNTPGDKMFSNTFYGCKGLSGEIPSGLFSSIKGDAKHGMFDRTFHACFGLNKIPSDLFKTIKGTATWLFNGTFQDCIGITEIPSGLFSTITGKQKHHMFKETFRGCKGINKPIPEDLFADINGVDSGENSDYMFQYTFYDCNNIPGTLPTNLFDVTVPGYAMFDRTFHNCKSLEGPIPGNLFGELSGNVQKWMFNGTFAHCEKLTGQIPETLFMNLGGKPLENSFKEMFDGSGVTEYIWPKLFKNFDNRNYEVGPMSNIFTNTVLWEKCPENMYQYITGFEADWSGKVSCEYCPTGQWQTADGKSCEIRQYLLSYNCNGANSTPPESQTVKYKTGVVLQANTCTRPGYTFEGWYFDDKPDVTLKSGTYHTYQYISNKTLYAKWKKNTYSIALDSNLYISKADAEIVQNPDIVATPTPLFTQSGLAQWYSDKNLSAGSFVTKLAQLPKVNKYIYTGFTVDKFPLTDAVRVITKEGMINPTAISVNENTKLYAQYSKCVCNTLNTGGIESCEVIGTNDNNECIYEVTCAPNYYIENTTNTSSSETFRPKCEPMFVHKITLDSNYYETADSTNGMVADSNADPSTLFLNNDSHNKNKGWYQRYLLNRLSNPITELAQIPTYKQGLYSFQGFYTGKSGTGIQVIDASGKLITTDEVLNAFSDNATIYAYYRYIDPEYTVTYSCGEGTGTPPAPQKVKYQAPFTVAANNNCTKDGHRFIRWSVSDTTDALMAGQYISYPYTSDKTLVAQYVMQNSFEQVAQIYNITYDANHVNATGVAPISPTTCVVGETCLAPENTFSVIGYDFNGWKCSGVEKCEEEGFVLNPGYDLSNLNADALATITLIAQWKDASFVIEYESAGGVGTAPILKSCEYSNIYECITPENSYVRNGYNFKSWAYSTDTGHVGIVYPGNELGDLFENHPNVVTLTATWDGMGINFTYNANGGTQIDYNKPIEPRYCRYGSTCVAPANPYKKDNYQFIGWKCSGDICANTNTLIATGTDLNSILSDNISDDDTVELIAQWAEERFFIEYNKGSDEAYGTAPTEPTSCLFGETGCLVPQNTFYKTGYKFTGWLCSGDEALCAGTVLKPGDSLAGSTNIIGGTVYLIAQWAPITFKVNYNTYGGGYFATQTCTYDEDCFIPENKPYKTGYEFKYWCEALDCPIQFASGENLRNFTGVDNAEVTMHANYEKIEIDFNLEYYENDDSTEPFAIQTCSMHEPCIAKDAITKTGYKFNTWRCSGDVACNGENIAPSTDLVNVSIDGSTVKLTGVWNPNKFNIVYEGNGTTQLTEPLEPTSCTYDQNCFVPSNTYVYAGYNFIQWKCSIDGVACANEYISEGTNIKNITPVDDATVTLSAQWITRPEFPFSVKTTPDTSEFAFDISASGTFYIDWGDGTLFETIEKTDTTTTTVSHTYKTADTRIIQIGGNATGYRDSDWPGSISFWNNKNVNEIYGRLGAIFGTLPDGVQPSFSSTFANCTNLTGQIPHTLFEDIVGTGRPYMFNNTFSGCSGLIGDNVIPDALFDTLAPELSEGMFSYTFANCTNIANIPALFTNFTTSAPSAFYGTFSTCESLGAIPENLFGITDNVAADMFAETFAGCSGINEIPESLFENIGEAPGNYAFINTFAATGITEVPPLLFSRITTPSVGLFEGTFEQCSYLQTVPTELFSTISYPTDRLFARTFESTGLTEVPTDLFAHMSGEPASGMFENTFAYSKIESAIPENLFGDISGTPVSSMMSGMFTRTSAISYISPNLFKNIDNTNYQSGPMSYIFQNTNMWESCPTTMRQYITGFEVDLSGKVSCIDCPAYSAQRAEDATWCQCFDGYSLDGTSNGEIYTQTVDCQPIKYNANYLCGEGTGTAPETQRVAYGEQYTIAENTGCSYKGHSFAGWKMDIKDVVYSSGDVITWNLKDDISFVATWKQNPYQITFDKMGGTGGTDSVTVMYGEYPPEIETPTKEGYEFIGYYDNEDRTNALKYYEGNGTPSFPWNVASDGTLYAQYDPKIYQYKYDCGEGTGTAPDGGDIFYKQLFTFAENTCVAPNGYVFDKWSETYNGESWSAGESITWLYTDNKTFIATYVPGEYTVTFHSNYGEDKTVVETFVYDNAYVLHQQYRRTGSDFVGYATTPDGEVVYKDGAIVSNLTDVVGGNVDLYSIWEPFTTPFEYNGNGGIQVVYPIVPTTCSGDETCIAPENPFERTGYEFIGWTCSGHAFCDSGLFAPGTDLRSSIIQTISKNEVITMTAQWKPITFTVVYDVDGGNPEIESQTCTYDTECFVSDITPTKPGYSFEIWEYVDGDNKDLISPSTNITNITDVANATISLVAQYAPNTYTITYNANGGAGEMSPTTFNHGDTVTLASNTFVRDGYEFNGWSTTTDGGVEYSDGQEISGLTGDITLYAVWSVAMCVVNSYTPSSALTGLETVANLAANSKGRIYYDSGSSAYKFKDNGMELYNAGQDFKVNFSNGTLTGLAFCGVAGSYDLHYTTSALSRHQSGRGCWCRYGVEHVAESEYVWERASLFSNVDVCRSECPALCAQLVADDLEFRANLLAEPGSAEYNDLLNGACPSDDLVSPCEYKEGYTVWYNKANNECVYTPITYTVTYHANGGTGEMESSIFTYDVAGILSPNTFTRTGYTFNGWATIADGEKVYNDEDDVLNWANTQGAQIDLYALWTPITYTVEYNANGGDGTMTPSVFTYDVSGNLRTNTFTRDGYDFIGWSTDSNASDAEYSNGDIVLNWSNVDSTVIILYAVWQEKQAIPQVYTVVYSCGLGTGSAPATTTVEYKAEFTPAANTCTMGANEFTGWKISDTETVVQPNENMIWEYTTNKVFTAQWKEIGGGGSDNCDPSVCVTTIKLPESETVTARTASELASASIIGPSITTSTKINNMAAYVEDQRWSVTFENSGETINGFAICGPSGRAANAAGHTTSGSKYLLAKALTTNQAYYGCYCKSGDNITDDTLYASLKQLKPSGTTTAAQKIDYCRARCPYECANAVATDAIYRKAMLADSSDSVCNCNEVTPPAPNDTFKIHMYTDVYTKIGETDVTYNQPISGLLTPEQNDKVFVGWFDEGGVQYSNGDIYTKQSDTIVYARWEDVASQYTVVYNANGGNGDMESSVFTYDIAGKLRPNTFTRTDYDFLGWARSSDATTPEYADQAEVYNWSDVNGDVINLYAVWKIRPATYTVTYHANGGDGDMSQSTFEIGVEYSLSLNEFTRAGYTFKHWATNSDGSGNTYTDGQNVTNLTTNRGANVDLYAVWQPKIYTITYMANGGLSADYSLNIEFGANMPNVDIPTPADGYVFTGYYLEPTGGTQYYDATGTPVSTYVVYNRTENLVLYAGWKARACEPTGNYSPTSVLTDIPTLSELETAGFLYWDSGSSAYKFKTGGMAEYNKDQRFTFEYSDGVNTTKKYGTAFCGPNGSGDRTKKYYKTDKLSVYQSGKGCWCRYGLSDEEQYIEILEDGTSITYPWERASTSTDAETCRTECPMICAELTATETDSKFRDILLNGKTIDCAETGYDCPEKPGYTAVYNTETNECDYTPNTYIITLDPDGGETTQTSISVVYEGDVPNAEIPTRDGYLFMGYFTDRNGAGDQFFDEFGAPISSIYTLTTDITVYASWKEPVCTDYDGIVLERCNTPIMSSQEMVDNGLLEYKSTSEYKIKDFDKYMHNQKWAVNFPTYGEGTGTISGSAFCGPINKAEYGTVVKSIEDLPLAGTTLKQAHAGCWCQVGPTDTTKLWVAAGKYDEGSTWAEKTDACRASCPDFCAQLVATDASFRAKLYGGEDSCPVGTNYKKACCDGEYETENGSYEPCPDGTWCQNCQMNECDAEAMYTATNGATSPNACGTYLHVGDHKIFMRPNAKMTPLALHVNKRGTIFHANMSTEKPDDGKEKHLKTMVDGIVYYIYDNFLI